MDKSKYTVNIPLKDFLEMEKELEEIKILKQKIDKIKDAHFATNMDQHKRWSLVSSILSSL